MIGIGIGTNSVQWVLENDVERDWAEEWSLTSIDAQRMLAVEVVEVGEVLTLLYKGGTFRMWGSLHCRAVVTNFACDTSILMPHQSCQF